jgi:putative component of membrane protein insertase Oxa1/YidC/SpoIIIJ protein YidD
MMSRAEERARMAPDLRTRMVNPFNMIMVGLITVYQRATVDKEHVCTMIPSCSEFNKRAYERFGFIRATAISIRRILECNGLRERHDDLNFYYGKNAGEGI